MIYEGWLVGLWKCCLNCFQLNSDIIRIGSVAIRLQVEKAQNCQWKLGVVYRLKMCPIVGSVFMMLFKIPVKAKFLYPDLCQRWKLVAIVCRMFCSILLWQWHTPRNEGARASSRPWLGYESSSTQSNPLNINIYYLNKTIRSHSPHEKKKKKKGNDFFEL